MKLSEVQLLCLRAISFLFANVNSMRVNKIEVYGRSRVNVKVEPCSTSTLTWGFQNIASILFTHVKLTCART